MTLEKYFKCGLRFNQFHLLPTCVNEEDGCTGKGGGVKAAFVLREVATHHRTQDEADTGGCIEVSHHQRAL